MTQKTKSIHPAAEMYANEVKQGKLDRREFMSRATALGVTTVAAYGLLGINTPLKAGGHAKQGGTIQHADGSSRSKRSSNLRLDSNCYGNRRLARVSG